MAVGASGDVPPTLQHHPAGVMGNPGDQAGLMVHEFEAFVQDDLTLAMWISIMWILISLVISYGLNTIQNKETDSANIFEELENKKDLSNYYYGLE